MIRVPLSTVCLGQSEKNYAINAVESGWISSSGEYVESFENAIAAQCGRKYAIAVSNGTVALELVLRAMNIGPGDEVIVPALTFVAPAAVVRSVGARPVFADITQSNWTIDPEDVKRVVNSKTQAIIAVDVLGHPCNYDRLFELGIPILEDAAQAHGALYKGKAVGMFGVASTFSFHANKIITTGEGGCVLTDDKDLAHRMRIIAGHGMTKERPYWHPVVGSNFRMTNVTAAIGLGQAERWNELVAERDKVSLLYDQLLTGVDVTFRPREEWAKASCWLYTVCNKKRERILNSLRSDGIDARAIWPSLCSLPLYQNSVVGDYPIARAISQQAFWLPTWSAMPRETISFVANRLADSCAESVHKDTIYQRTDVD
ncbi:MAG: DegT/DnrJ/EryC1/StrS family aminotransferase [Desulfobacteraceae bacterium]|nr:DegT/DnrJ/EryC1/StrS family aminotransferase [Desulfobacteraceae bacterium]MBC2755232.1 DegT/DnrJ/EryC1/StrS family aminotransferase [Desulfobacteraceae bacterium]